MLVMIYLRNGKKVLLKELGLQGFLERDMAALVGPGRGSTNGEQQTRRAWVSLSGWERQASLIGGARWS